MSDQPPELTEPPALLPPSGPPNDTILRGCGMGCATTVVFILLALGAGFLADGKKGDYLFMSWGYVQLIGLIPLIMRERSRGYRKSVTGLIISGCISVLLGTACAAMLMNFNVH